MVTRRGALKLTSALAATLVASPSILQAQTKSGTPVVNGKRVRRKLSTLADNDPFFVAYAEAVKRLHDPANSDVLTWLKQGHIHADFCQHTEEFFPWHRPFIHSFEKICAKLIGDENFAVPYWNWPDNSGRMPKPFFENGPLNVMTWSDSGQYNGIEWGPVDTAPYRYAREDFGLLEGPGAGAFSAQAMTDMENASTFDLLTGLTDSPHGTGHVVVGGNPAWGLGTAEGHFSSGLSPLDPIFWMHHANVDRIWAGSAITIADQKSAMPDINKVYSGIFLDADGNPNDVKLDDIFDLQNYDYTYDFLVPELVSMDIKLLNKQVIDAQQDIISFAKANNIEIFEDFPQKLTRLAENISGETVTTGKISRITLESSQIAESLTTERLAPRSLQGGPQVLALGSGKLYAQLNDVKLLPGSEGGLIKVFVNCPYLSELTPTTDMHFAGIVSLFGCNPERCGPRSFTVELTQPLKAKLEQGSIPARQLQVQLLPFSNKDSAAVQPLMTIGSAELLRI